MSEVHVASGTRRPERYAWLGAGSGIAAWIGLMLLVDRERLTFTHAMVLFAYVAPFVVALVALWRLRRVGRAGVWLGSGIAGLALMVTSPAALLFVPGAVLLIAAAILESSAWDRVGAVLAWAALVVVATVVAFSTAFFPQRGTMGATVSLATWIVVGAILTLTRRAEQ